MSWGVPIPSEDVSLLVSLRARAGPYIFDSNAWMLTPMAWKRTDGALHKMR